MTRIDRADRTTDRRRRPSPSAFKLIALLSVLACLGGCSRYASPKLSVADATVTDRTADGVTIEFIVDAVNTNEVGLPLKTIEYALSLDGKQVFTGERAPEATLRRFGSQQIRLPVAIPTPEDPAAFEGEKPYKLRGRLVYLTPGELADVLFDARLYRPSTSFTDGGVIDFGLGG